MMEMQDSILKTQDIPFATCSFISIQVNTQGSIEKGK